MARDGHWCGAIDSYVCRSAVLHAQPGTYPCGVQEAVEQRALARPPGPHEVDVGIASPICMQGETGLQGPMLRWWTGGAESAGSVAGGKLLRTRLLCIGIVLLNEFCPDGPRGAYGGLHLFSLWQFV